MSVLDYVGLINVWRHLSKLYYASRYERFDFLLRLFCAHAIFLEFIDKLNVINEVVLTSITKAKVRVNSVLV